MGCSCRQQRGHPAMSIDDCAGRWRECLQFSSLQVFLHAGIMLSMMRRRPPYDITSRPQISCRCADISGMLMHASSRICSRRESQFLELDIHRLKGCPTDHRCHWTPWSVPACEEGPPLGGSGRLIEKSLESFCDTYCLHPSAGQQCQ